MNDIDIDVKDVNTERARWLLSLREGSPVAFRHQDGFFERAEVTGIEYAGGQGIIVVRTGTETIKFVRATGHPYMERSFRIIVPITPEIEAVWKAREAILNAPDRADWLQSIKPGAVVLVNFPSGNRVAERRVAERVGECYANIITVSRKSKDSSYNFRREDGILHMDKHIYLSPALGDTLADYEVRCAELHRLKDLLLVEKWDTLTRDQIGRMTDIAKETLQSSVPEGGK